MCVLIFKSSHRPDGNITDVLASTLARTTAADTLVNFSLMYVPQRPVISHRPDGKFADALALTDDSRLATVADAPVNYSLYVPQRPRNFPSPRWENALLTCPIRFSSFMSGAALIYHRMEYVLSAPETLKAPIAPMGELLTRLPRLTLAQLRTLRSTTVCTCRIP